MRDLKDWAKQIWILESLEDKKLIAKDMVDNFQFKTKANDFKVKIDNMKSKNKLDSFVGDIVLVGEGLGVK